MARVRRSTVGRLIGLAGLAGVAATGVVLARDERQRRAYTPDDVRARLHERAEAATAAESTADRPESTTGFIPRANSRRGRLLQSAQWQRRRLADPVTTAIGNQVDRVRRRLRSSGD